MAFQAKFALMKRAQAQPVIISADDHRPKIERIYLGSGTHNEDWLQALIHGHPELLPISDIEPGFGEPIAVAREVPCGHGYIDNLLLTPSGEIILVEVKLWRNNQARREVVAQALDYVASLSAMSFDAFEAAIAKSQDAPSTLYASLAHHPDALAEPDFIDAVTRNLARGRMLVMALGDGIRQESEALAELLQSHAGAHFTFALVEIATWRNIDTEEIIAVPSTLAKTVMIERGIVRVVEGEPVIEPVPVDTPKRAQSISDKAFMDLMAERDPDLPRAIQTFIAHVEPIGVYPDQMASLNFKVELPNLDRPLNLGYIQKNGQLWTNPVAWAVPESIWKPYLDEISDAIGGETVIGKESYVSTDGKSAPRIEDILPHHADRWAKAIEALIERARDAANAGITPS